MIISDRLLKNPCYIDFVCGAGIDDGSAKQEADGGAE